MLNKKIALITGANRGIGKATAKSFAANGFHVVVGARDLSKAQAVADEITSAGGSAEPLLIDLANIATIQAAGTMFLQRHNLLDALVNNAGINLNVQDSILVASKSDIEVSLNTNAFGPLELVKALLPALRASKGARIVNVSSSVGSVSETANPESPYGFFDAASYRLSKTALNGITGMLAKTLRADGIKVNAICPGWVKTDMGGPDAPVTPDQAAALALKLATLSEDGPTGGFFNEAGTVLW